MTKKRGNNYGATVHIPGIDPTKYVVTAIVVRRDGEPLSAAEWAMCERALPDVQPVKELLEENERFERAAHARHTAELGAKPSKKPARSKKSAA